MNETVNVNQNKNQNIQENKYILLFRKNKYPIFAFSILLILITIFSSLIFVSSTTPTPSETVFSPTPVTRATIPPGPTVTAQAVQPGRVLTSPEQTIIEKQTKIQLDQRIEVSYTISQMNGYGEDWAIIEVSNPTTDPANVVVKKENGIWNVIMGPGTSFEEQGLRSIGAPESLINEVNGNI